MGGKVRAAASFIVPPERGDHDGAQRWMYGMAGISTILLIFAAWTLGAFAGVGFPGLARAAEVAALAEQLRDGRIDGLEGTIFELRLKQCAADTPALKPALGLQLTKFLRQYEELTGVPYQLPPCVDLR